MNFGGFQGGKSDTLSWIKPDYVGEKKRQVMSNLKIIF